MAPEVILGMDYDDKVLIGTGIVKCWSYLQSDVFSYGILLLEMILGTKTIKRELKRAPMNGFELDLSMYQLPLRISKD